MTDDPQPETALALLYRHGLPEDVIDGALCLHAQELATQIRSVTEQLKADGVLEPDKFRPCRDAADQIDPTREGSQYAPAVVPSAPADRAAILREAAARIEAMTGEAYERALSEDEIGYANGLENATAELRRMADEAQQPDPCSGCRYVPCGNCPTAAVSQPGKEG